MYKIHVTWRGGVSLEGMLGMVCSRGGDYIHRQVRSDIRCSRTRLLCPVKDIIVKLILVFYKINLVFYSFSFIISSMLVCNA